MPSIPPDLMDRLAEQLLESESEKLTAYRCSKGFLTVGIGHNCEASPVPGVSRVGDRITQDQSRALFAVDMGKAIVDVQKYLPWEGNLAWPRRAVLYDLCVNMGIGFPPANGNKGRGLRSFVNSLRAIERGDFQAGAAGLMNSAYARDVASDGWGGRFDRAERLAVQLITGVWQTAKRGRQ